MYKKALNVVFSVLIFVLVGTLAFSCYTIQNKNSNIESLNSNIEDLNRKIAENLELIENHLTIQKELQDKIQNNESEIKDLNQKLVESIAKVNSLTEENNLLKVKMDKIKLESSKTAKVCYLTFDDGPSENTLKILDVLDKYNVKATFFVVKNSNAEYIKKTALKGHTIGLHTATHNYSYIYETEDAYFTDLKAVSDVVEEQIGYKTNVIRFPGGSSNKISIQYNEGIMTRLTELVVQKNYFYFDWNVDSGDASASNVKPEVIRDNVLKNAKGKKSICVLMHDTSSKGTTVEALPEIIEGLIEMGYRFATLNDESFGFRHEHLNN